MMRLDSVSATVMCNRSGGLESLPRTYLCWRPSTTCNSCGTATRVDPAFLHFCVIATLGWTRLGLTSPALIGLTESLGRRLDPA